MRNQPLKSEASGRMERERRERLAGGERRGQGTAPFLER